MSGNHALKVEAVKTREVGEYLGRCTCGWLVRKPRRQDVEDLYVKHEETVQRARAALTTKTPSLKSQHQFYEEMAADPGTPEKDVPHWRMLADELAKRLGLVDGKIADNDTPLF